MKKTLASIIPNRFKHWLKRRLGAPDLKSSLLKLRQNGFKAERILDIGAYQGDWTRMVKGVFPEAKVMMLEGQTQKEHFLKDVSGQLKNVSYELCLLGAEDKEVQFNRYETASSVWQEHHETGAETETRTLQRLDDLISKTHFGPADLIKLDTQGYELEILKGGPETLQHAQAVLMEVSFIDIYAGSPLAHEVMEFMQHNGFVLYDICSLMRRPYDEALFQSDFLFVKKDSFLRSSKRWS